jgi:cell division protein FtsB
MNIWNVIYRFSWGLLAVLIVVGFILIFTPKARKLSYLQGVKAEIEVRNAEKADQIKALQSRQERFVSDPEFVEHTAREAGLVMAGEIVYKFTNEQDHSRQP